MKTMSAIKQFAASSVVVGVLGLGFVGGTAMTIAAPANAAPSHEHVGPMSPSAHASTEHARHARLDPHFSRPVPARLDPHFKPQPIATPGA